jgi:hypothetical protein
MNLANTIQDEPEKDINIAPDIKIRSYTNVGSVLGFGRVSVEAREHIVPDRKQVSYFVKFEIQSGGDYPQTVAAVVGYDNIQSLIDAIERMSHLTISSDRFSFSEIEYEVDGLSIIIFNNDRGKLQFAVTAGNTTVHFSSMADLNTLRVLVVRAKEHIDRHKFEV